LLKTKFVSTNENSRKSTFVYIALLYPRENVLPCVIQSHASSLPTSYHFHVMLLLVNVMVPSELCQ